MDEFRHEPAVLVAQQALLANILEPLAERPVQ
jgi:hypothetical protein